METKEAQKLIVEHLADDWGLLTVGSIDDYNTMTIAWGETGTMWGKPVVPVYVVPSRYTYGYMQGNDYFVVSLFPPEYREDLQVLGTKSGRDGDKVALTKLTPKPIEHGVTFEEASLTVVCRKLFRQPLDPARCPIGSCPSTTRPWESTTASWARSWTSSIGCSMAMTEMEKLKAGCLTATMIQGWWR